MFNVKGMILLKRFLSLFMALVLVLGLSMNLAAPAFAATGYSSSSGISYSTSTGGSSGVSIGTSVPANNSSSTWRYVYDESYMADIPVKIYCFTTSSRTVRVRIGNTTLFCPVVHKGGKYGTSTITCELDKANLNLGLDSLHNVSSGSIAVRIVIARTSRVVPTHTLKATGMSQSKSVDKVRLPACSGSVNCNASFGMETTMELNGAVKGSTYKTEFACYTADEYTTLCVRNMEYRCLKNGKVWNYGVSNTNGTQLRGSRCWAEKI